MKKKLHELPAKFNCKAPFLFALPVSDYSAEMERERNKELFLKTKQLERKTQELKESMQQLLQRYTISLERTRLIIATSLAVNNNFYDKKSLLK